MNSLCATELHCQVVIWYTSVMNTLSILDNLKTQGHKNTRVRQALIELLIQNHHPLSIAELLENLSKQAIKPNKTTIYREIEFLNQQKVLEEIDFGDGKKRYEISENHHHHIICINCQKVTDVPMERDLNFKEKQIIKDLGYKPIGNSLEFFGLCSNCQ